MDHFRTLDGHSEFRQKIERSEFLGIVFPVTTDDAFFAELTRIEKLHFNATHHCWAFRLFAGGDVRARSADAGEPSGSAGKPILAAIEGAGVYDVAAVVVRWYGGVKLGTGGLARAYRDTGAEALRIATTRDRYVRKTFRVEIPFDALGVAYRLAAPPDVLLMGESFQEVNIFTFGVRLSQVEAFADELTTKRLAFTIDAESSVLS